MSHFTIYHKQDILSLTKIRKFETKLGERVQVLEDGAGAGTLAQSIGKSPAEYVVLGIPEDIGAKANDSLGGTASAWIPFLQSFLNIQSNEFLPGDSILVLGQFDFSDLRKLIEANAQGPEERVEAYRHAVHTIDEEVEGLVKII